MGDSVEPHACEVCYHNYNEKSRIPKVLTCGHTYCARCVREMFNHGASILSCPVCRVVTRSRLARVSTNFQLLRVIKEQKLLCTEKDEEEVNNNPDNQEPMVNEEIDDGIFSMMKHFETEVNTLKAMTTSLGLNFAHCFPNTKFISGTLPDTEDSNTLSAIMNGVNRLHSTYTGVCFLLRKAKHQNELVAEQMQAGTAKKLPNGGVELKHERPNGNPVDDHDLLYPPTPGALFDPPDDDDNSWDNDDGESYSAESQLISYGGNDLGDDLQNILRFNPPVDLSGVQEWGAPSHHIWDQAPSEHPWDTAPSDDGNSNFSSNTRECSVCNCRLPIGAYHTRVHENGRRHRNNLERQLQGLPPETPERRGGGRGGRGGLRGGGRGRGGRGQRGRGGWGIRRPIYDGPADHDIFMGAPSNQFDQLYGDWTSAPNWPDQVW